MNLSLQLAVLNRDAGLLHHVINGTAGTGGLTDAGRGSAAWSPAQVAALAGLEAGSSHPRFPCA